MAKKQSVQKELEKVRPPRVQLTYDVEIGDAIEQKEIPFVVGVVGDFTGKREDDRPLPKLRDRKFVNVDVDNFDEVMKGVGPTVSFSVPDRIGRSGGEFGVQLRFERMEDFSPEAVVARVDQLRRLLEIRTHLSDLRNKLAGNERLEDALSEALRDTEQLQRLGKETRKEKP
jgi:type VI secretion system protein ImpB